MYIYIDKYIYMYVHIRKYVSASRFTPRAQSAVPSSPTGVSCCVYLCTCVYIHVHICTYTYRYPDIMLFAWILFSKIMALYSQHNLESFWIVLWGTQWMIL